MGNYKKTIPIVVGRLAGNGGQVFPQLRILIHKELELLLLLEIYIIVLNRT